MRKQSARVIFGKRVKELRIKCGWTQRELARRAAISKSYLQRIESKKPPDVTLDIIAKLAQGLKLNCSELIKQF